MVTETDTVGAVAALLVDVIVASVVVTVAPPCAPRPSAEAERLTQRRLEQP